MKKQVWPLIGLASVVGFLLGLVAVTPGPTRQRGAAVRQPNEPVEPLSVSVGPPVQASPAGLGVDFSAVAARLNAAVVSIDSAARGDDRSAVRQPGRLFPDAPNGSREGAGSGFIIDAKGFILTNNHVVDPADRIAVTLSDGRTYRATLVGSDPAIDVALLQINASGPLAVAPLGDSDKLRVGEWVCAIGNPLTYMHSVTVGVVSFLNRKIINQNLDAFIQTDAAITFGSSGGPLINSRGEVIGITTLVSAEVANISFAVPMSQVIAVLPQLRERGRVSRGFIEMGLRDVTAELQRALRLGPSEGALIQDIELDSPADVAGLRAYDVVIAVDGKPMRSNEALVRYVAAHQPGTIVRLDVWRDGATRVVPIKLVEQPLARAATLPLAVSAAAVQSEALGLVIKDIDVATSRRLPEAMAGVLVSDVDAAGPARVAGVQRGHVLLEINRRRVSSAAEYRALVAALKPGEAVALLIYDVVTRQRVIYSVVLDSKS